MAKKVNVKKMLKELVKNGYVYTSKLSDTEIIREYYRMINEMSAVKEEEESAIDTDIELCDEEETKEVLKGLENTSFIEVNSQKDLYAALFEEAENKNKEESAMITEETINVTNNDATTIKEESTMKKVNVHSNNYVTKDMLRKELKTYGIELSNTKFKNTKREELLIMLEEAKIDIENDNLQQIENHEIMHGEQEDITETTVTVDDYWNAENATKVILIIMDMAKKNRYVSFISHHMATSAICEVLFGRPLKDSHTKQDNVFTEEEKKLVAEFRNRFAEKYLILNDKGTGYTIKSIIMAWYYRKVIYRFQNNNQVVDYIVDYNNKTIIRVGGTNITTLDDEAFKKLDNTCKFMHVTK